MDLLSESELRQRVLQQNLLVKNLSNPSTQIRGCSVDLTIGDIYVPGTKEEELGSAQKPRSGLTLEQGQTAVIRTHETVVLSASQGGVVFPTSSVSLKGLLMTNPGHIDPGYSGHLHVTVINIGSQPFSLEKGGRLLRALFFEQSNVATTSLGSIKNPITEELLQRLSVDFLDIEKRTIANAEKAIEKADLKTKLIGQYLPVAIAILAALAAWFGGITKVEERITKMEGSLPTSSRLDGISERLSKIEVLVPAMSRLDTLEKQVVPSVESRLTELEAKGKKESKAR